VHRVFGISVLHKETDTEIYFASLNLVICKSDIDDA